ncbi:ATP-binding protein [uncultured Aquitalea sp.]|uniref:ATP-binding protein n=1 Tax=uncultured Aquitalea sp. TaxID=540272 RepID=UPI0025F206ED|nr:ATP-binding protein [uncultured Aquitalea sp.]
MVAQQTRIAIIGPESCGKTTLAQDLRNALQNAGETADWAAEYAREYYADRPYTVAMADIEAIARGQLETERRHADADWLLCDTTVVTCVVWAQVAFGAASGALAGLNRPQDYALTVLTAPDIPWQPDPLRSHPAQRDWLFGLYQAEIAHSGIPPLIVRGSRQARVDSVWQALRALRSGLPDCANFKQ